MTGFLTIMTGFLTAKEARDIARVSNNSEENILLREVLDKVMDEASCGNTSSTTTLYNKDQYTIDYIETNLLELGYKVEVIISPVNVVEHDHIGQVKQAQIKVYW